VPAAAVIAVEASKNLRRLIRLEFTFSQANTRALRQQFSSGEFGWQVVLASSYGPKQNRRSGCPPRRMKRIQPFRLWLVRDKPT
jgi:hypothetical protein